MSSFTIILVNYNLKLGLILRLQLTCSFLIHLIFIFKSDCFLTRWGYQDFYSIYQQKSHGLFSQVEKHSFFSSVYTSVFRQRTFENEVGVCESISPFEISTSSSSDSSEKLSNNNILPQKAQNIIIFCYYEINFNSKVQKIATSLLLMIISKNNFWLTVTWNLHVMNFPNKSIKACNFHRFPSFTHRLFICPS